MFTFLSKASDGGIVFISRYSRRSKTWIWGLSWSPKRHCSRTVIVPRSERLNQWHHSTPLFGGTLYFSRQDYHRDPRHWHA